MYPYLINMNECIRSFNQEIEKMAQEHKIRRFDLILTETDFVDGVHLNQAGIENVSKQLSTYILKDKGLEIA
jgi:hypothetical protein